MHPDYFPYPSIFSELFNDIAFFEYSFGSSPGIIAFIAPNPVWHPPSTQGIAMTQPTAPFAQFAPRTRSPTRCAPPSPPRIAAPEARGPGPLLAQARLPQRAGHGVAATGAAHCQNRCEAQGQRWRAGPGAGLLQEFSLSSQEGVALMCLAEALLRIPDKATRDALIRDKISNGQWDSHLGKAPRCSSTPPPGACCITGKLVATHSESSLGSSLSRLIGRAASR